jgi:hypothetical protein
VIKDKCLKFVSDEAKEQARERAGDHGELADLLDGSNTPDDIARRSGKRYHALTWVADLVEEGLVSLEEPEAQEGDSEEDWDFSL